MLWMKQSEISLEDNSKKIVLERVTLFGHRRRIKFIETTSPTNHQSSENYIASVTQRRSGWRFRIKHPIRTTYYKKNTKGEWILIGTVFP